MFLVLFLLPPLLLPKVSISVEWFLTCFFFHRQSHRRADTVTDKDTDTDTVTVTDTAGSQLLLKTFDIF